jgi:hypothetical protein
MHETKPFGVGLAREEVDPCDVAARLATSPSATGSSATPNTIGMVEVAALAASVAGLLPGVAITATWRLTASFRIAAMSS